MRFGEIFWNPLPLPANVSKWTAPCSYLFPPWLRHYIYTSLLYYSFFKLLEWVKSPGVQAMNDPSQQPRLEAYVKNLVGTFANDTRVLGWDVFNEPLCGGVGESQSLYDLVTNAFEWCRSVDPIQLCTAPLFSTDVDFGDYSRYNNISKIILNNSDVITFHE
jgi:hypothetical protein